MDNGRPNWLARIEQPKLLIVVACMLVLAAFGVLRLDDDDRAVDLAVGRTTTTMPDAGRDAGGDVRDDGDGGGGDVLADDSTTTTSSASSSSSTSSTTSTAVAPTTTTTVCRNSKDAACGPFRWDPEPSPNQPLVVTVTTSAEQAVAGQPFSFTVEATDTDAQPVFCEVFDLGDGTTKGVIGTRCGDDGTAQPPCEPRYGPWTPPTRKGGVFTYTVTHTYAAAGTYTVQFFSYSEDGGECHPYGSTKTTERKVTVVSASS